MPKNKFHPIRRRRPQARGDVAIYVAMLMLIVVTSSALLLSGLLSQQLRFSQEVVSSERAFYAANSGVEHALYLLAQANQAGNSLETVEIEGEVPYEEETAVYEGAAELVLSEDLTTATPCVKSTGSFRDQVRRLILLPPEGECL